MCRFRSVFLVYAILAAAQNAAESPVRVLDTTVVSHDTAVRIGRFSQTFSRKGRSVVPDHVLDPHSVRNSLTSDLQFHKCAQVVSGSDVQLRVTLTVWNVKMNLSQLSIRDTVSDITLLLTNGSVQERGFQSFSTEALPAGLQYKVDYTMHVTVEDHTLLSLPAFLTFSNSTQFGPLIANFTLRINKTQQGDLGRAVLFVYFIGSFLLVLLSCVCAVVLNILLRRRPQVKNTSNTEVDQCETVIDIISANTDDAALEDKFVDIVMLEQPENMMQALDCVNDATVLHASQVMECVRVQLNEGLLAVLLSGLQGAERPDSRVEQRVRSLVQEQLLGAEERMREAHRQYNGEMLELQRYKLVDEASELQAQMETQHDGNVRLGHADAASQAQRRQAIGCRLELHRILGAVLEEAARAGEMQKSSIHKLLQQYYSCQDAVEEALDVLVANQRALLAERHEHRRLLLHGVVSFHYELSESISSCARQPDLLSEIGSVQLMEMLSCEFRAAHCDVVKKRRKLLSEKMSAQQQQLKQLCGGREGPVSAFLQNATALLLQQDTDLSSLIAQLDQETASGTSQTAVCVLQKLLGNVSDAASHFLPQMELLHGKMQKAIKAAASCLHCSRMHQRQEQELQGQRCVRDQFRRFCRRVCQWQASLSADARLSLRLECVKAACCLDLDLTSERASCCEGLQTQQLCECEEHVCERVARLHWSEADERRRLSETHAALLNLQMHITALLQHTPQLTQTIRTHQQALEAELHSQAERCDLIKEREETNRRSDQAARLLKRNQMLQDQKQQLHSFCQQELRFTAALLKHSGASACDVLEALSLLLPTLPEGDLQTLVQTLVSTEDEKRCCISLTQRVRDDLLDRNHLKQAREGERDRLLENILQPLFFSHFTNERKSEKPVGEKPVDDQRVFVFRCNSMTTLTTHASNTAQPRKKKRNFLNFKKTRVTPQSET